VELAANLDHVVVVVHKALNHFYFLEQTVELVELMEVVEGHLITLHLLKVETEDLVQ
jgi:hypothetical protein